ncbi:MAG: universal stress protein [Acidimicrobiia bacterium]|nr:universal stress protein [Acidimicrobiia bacterium]
MKPIVCAVRGGPGSHFTRRAALERSIATGAPLYILVTVAPDAYLPLHAGEQRAIRAELAWRELALARADASQLGQPDAQFNIQVRVGDLGETLAAFAAEVDAGAVLIGSPRDAVDAALNGTDVEELIDGVAQLTNADVSVIAPG